MATTKKPVVPSIKATIKTETMRVQLEGRFPGSLIDIFDMVSDRATREALLKTMQARHERLCQREDERAAKAAEAAAVEG